jgi:hypothetical protein
MPHDLGEHGLGADALGAHHQRARPVHGRADDAAPGVFSTGIGSPVIIDSSTVLRPSITTPSTGTFSPAARAGGRRPRPASSGTSSSVPSRDARAAAAPSPSSARIAAPVRARRAQLEHLAQQHQRHDHARRPRS